MPSPHRPGDRRFSCWQEGRKSPVCQGFGLLSFPGVWGKYEVPREAGHLEYRRSYGPDIELCVLASPQDFLCLSFLIVKQGIIISHK